MKVVVVPEPILLLLVRKLQLLRAQQARLAHAEPRSSRGGRVLLLVGEGQELCPRCLAPVLLPRSAGWSSPSFNMGQRGEREACARRVGHRQAGQELAVQWDRLRGQAGRRAGGSVGTGRP